METELIAFDTSDTIFLKYVILLRIVEDDDIAFVLVRGIVKVMSAFVTFLDWLASPSSRWLEPNAKHCAISKFAFFFSYTFDGIISQ